VNQKVKAMFKLRGNRDREEPAHCAVLTVPVEEFSHVQYSALPSVKWQQRGRKHGQCLLKCSAMCSTALCLQSSGSNEGVNMDAPLQHCTNKEQRGVVRFLWGRRSETCGNSPSGVGSVTT